MILDKFRIDGQVAVVTGGSKGLGRAVATALAEAGADIAVVSRSPSDDLASSVRALGRRYMFHRADLTDRAQPRGVIPAVLEALGDIHILVNNAGIVRRSAAMEYSKRPEAIRTSAPGWWERPPVGS